MPQEKLGELLENEQPASYVNLSVSLDPPIELPTENEQAYYPGREDQGLLEEGTRWVNAMRLKVMKKFKNPRIMIFGENTAGRSVYIPRFLYPLAPPRNSFIDIESDYAIENCARFVAMCPFVEDLRMFSDLPDLFTTCQQFFDLGGGDYEEHAILLANYFNYVDNQKQQAYEAQGVLKGRHEFRSFIVLGEAMPEGHTVYVLRKQVLKPPLKETPADRSGSIELWAPCTGECYFYEEKKAESRLFAPEQYHLQVNRPTDPMCPLKKIHTVISSDNVYVNIQPSDFPVLMPFDFHNPKKWAAFVDGKSRKGETFFPLTGGKPTTVQELDLKYAPINPNTAVLENRIQKYLVEMFQQERIKTVKKLTKWTITQNH